MTNEPNCAGCTSLDEKGDCLRSILPLRRTDRVPECFAAAPDSMAAKYYAGAEEGYKAVDVAIAAMNDAAFANEQPLFAALNTGVGPHITDLSQEGLHHLSGFLAGTANRIREALALLSQPLLEPATQGDKHESRNDQP